MTYLYYILSLALSLAFPQIIQAEWSSQKFPAKDINQLILANGAGRTNISVTDNEEAEVRFEKKRFPKHCALNIELENNTLLAEVEHEKRWSFKRGDCRVNFDIRLPKKVDLNLKLGSGKINIQDTQGDLDLVVGSGDVLANIASGNLSARLGSGTLTVKGLTGSVDLKKGSGETKLSWITVPEKGFIKMKAGSGGADFYLPENAKVQTNIIKASGTLFNEFGDSHDANLNIDIIMGSGNVGIHKIKRQPSS